MTQRISRKPKHILRRVTIFILPLVIGIAISLIRMHYMDGNQIDIDHMVSVATTMLGFWGTSLGFIITAESILVAFDGSYLTKEIKETSHFKTVVYTYTLTCIELLVMIAIFSVIVLENTFSYRLLRLLIICLGVSLLDILLCLIFLGYLVLSTCRKEPQN